MKIFSNPICHIQLAVLTLAWASTQALSFAAQAPGQREQLQRIDAALQAGEADKALALIGSLPQGGANSAEARNLKCRVQFTLQQWDSAAQECAQAK